MAEKRGGGMEVAMEVIWERKAEGMVVASSGNVDSGNDDIDRGGREFLVREWIL